MTQSSIVAPATAIIIFSLGTSGIGAIANIILAKRIERTYGVDINILLISVIIASALNLLFALTIPPQKGLLE